MTETELRNEVVAQARVWLGRKEADGSHREIIDLYNNNRLPGTYKMTYDDPWCAAFVSAIGMAVGLGDVLLPHVNCDGLIAAYMAMCRWVEDDDYPAKPGDLIFYDWQDNGVRDNRGSSDHVGLIVADNEHYFTVIEGNYSDAVKERTIEHNSRYIRGFAVPDYEAAAKSAVQTQQTSAAILDQPDSAVGMADDTGSGLAVNPEPDNYIDDSRVTVSLPVLHYGSTGEAVRAAQILLIGRGHRCGLWGADADFGRATEGGVCSFQRSRRLAVDGVIGVETWAALMGVMT